MRHREAAVATLLAGISAYELVCKDGETISEFFDPHMEKRWKQIAFLGASGVMLAHMANLFSDDKDPVLKFLSPIRQAYKRRNAWTN